MKTEITRVLSLRNFFKINKSQSHFFIYNLKRPSILLLNNIYTNWLLSINSKTHKHMPVFIDKKFLGDQQTLPYGFLSNNLITYNENTVLEQDIKECSPKSVSQLQVNLAVPQQDMMQYFIQWQRYRKYWWSSVTTTPSLFTIKEVKCGEETTKADIVAQFSWGHHTVETLTTTFEKNNSWSHLKSSLTLENAMFILLLDGLNNTRKEFLRLHRSMAPYKISFALQINSTETSYMDDLSRLAKFMYYRLKSKDIPAYIPNFTHSSEQQIKESLELGVSYTAILCENTLNNGVFHMLNSNTMLKEEVHIADLDSYAALICKSMYLINK